MSQRYEVVPISAVRVHPKNPRRGNLDKIRESIRANGFVGSLLVQESTRHILAGNHRYLAAIAEGHTELPATFVDVDDATAARIVLADNRTSDLGTYDDSALLSLLDSSPLLGTGYDPEDLDEMLAKLGGVEPPQIDAAKHGPKPLDETLRELEARWPSEVGDEWTATKSRAHRLVRGSSLAVDAKGDGVVSDPPFDMSGEDLLEILSRFSQRSALITEARQFFGLLRAGLDYDQMLIWERNEISMNQGGPYAPKIAHALVGFFRASGTKTFFRTPSKEFKSILRPEYKSQRTTLYQYSKPPEIFVEMIRCAPSFKTIVDPFAGSMASVVAADRMRRTCTAIEIDRQAFAAGLERLSRDGFELRKVE